MANAKLVPPPSENVIQDTNTSTSRSSTLTPGSLQQASSSARQTPTCRMDLISQQLQAGGLSTQATELICASWTKGTEKQYKPVWKTWSSWCDQRHINPLQGNAVHLVNFLAEQFHQGKSYSTLRTVTLCSLVSAQREHTLCSLDLDNMSIYEDEIKFVIGSRTKTTRPGKKPLEVSIPSLPTNLCPKQTLLHFVFIVRNTCASQGSRLYLSCSFLMLNHTSLFPHLL